LRQSPLLNQSTAKHFKQSRLNNDLRQPACRQAGPRCLCILLFLFPIYQTSSFLRF